MIVCSVLTALIYKSMSLILTSSPGPKDGTAQNSRGQDSDMKLLWPSCQGILSGQMVHLPLDCTMTGIFLIRKGFVTLWKSTNEWKLMTAIKMGIQVLQKHHLESIIQKKRNIIETELWQDRKRWIRESSSGVWWATTIKLTGIVWINTKLIFMQLSSSLNLQ